MPPPPSSDLSYPAMVTLARDWIDVDGRRETIQPGMQVSAEIKTGDRRAIDFLLSPFLQTIREAGRERCATCKRCRCLQPTKFCLRIGTIAKDAKRASRRCGCGYLNATQIIVSF